MWADALLLHGRFGGNARTAVAGAVFLVMAAATWWIGTSATRRGLVVHALPPMAIPWAEVREIEVRTSSAARSSSCTTARELPAPPRCPRPFTGPIGKDDEFQDKVRALRSLLGRAARDRAPPDHFLP